MGTSATQSRPLGEGRNLRVEATRNDRWVQRHGAPVEVDKPPSESGAYQNPDLYDQPDERAAYHLPAALTSPGTQR